MTSATRWPASRSPRRSRAGRCALLRGVAESALDGLFGLDRDGFAECESVDALFWIGPALTQEPSLSPRLCEGLAALPLAGAPNRLSREYRTGRSCSGYMGYVGRRACWHARGGSHRASPATTTPACRCDRCCIGGVARSAWTGAPASMSGCCGPGCAGCCRSARRCLSRSPARPRGSICCCSSIASGAWCRGCTGWTAAACGGRRCARTSSGSTSIRSCRCTCCRKAMHARCRRISPASRTSPATAASRSPCSPISARRSKKVPGAIRGCTGNAGRSASCSTSRRRPPGCLGRVSAATTTPGA